MTTVDEQPREKNGRFDAKVNSEPETTLQYVSAVSPGALIADYALGNARLEAAATREDVADIALSAWEVGRIGDNGLGEPDEFQRELGALIGDTSDFTRRDLHRIAEVAYYRGITFTPNESGERKQLLHSDELWTADTTVQLASGEHEVGDHVAAVLAESILQRLPGDARTADFPRLAEAAAFPDAFDPRDHEKVDALHRELGGIYDRLQPAQRPRADALFTWSLNGPSGPLSDQRLRRHVASIA